jgi:hypothetical protein
MNKAVENDRLRIIRGPCYTYTVLACPGLGLFEMVCRRSSGSTLRQPGMQWAASSDLRHGQVYYLRASALSVIIAPRQAW